MPDGSSSAAPVVRPGPRMFQYCLVFLTVLTSVISTSWTVFITASSMTATSVLVISLNVFFLAISTQVPLKHYLITSYALIQCLVGIARGLRTRRGGAGGR